jgi:transcriptional regulator with XRE-family HTH domain
MKPRELKSARLDIGWTQCRAAKRLGITQAYLNYLENGKRRLTPGLVRRAASVYRLSSEVLSVSSDFVPAKTNDQRLTEWLAQLGYPGFSYIRSHAAKQNPSETILTALAQESLDGRVAEALPWIALKYLQPGRWLVENARRFNLQNKLGFVVGLASQLAERRGDAARLAELRELIDSLEESRLAAEGAFYRPPRTESEREWLKQNRSEDARHWNLLTDLRPEHLRYD